MTGPVLLSGHPDYDGARNIWNGMHDKRPALIARCMNNQDVANAVTFARERELLVAVRGGGHSWPGKSVCDDGLMIDLSQLTSVTVDTDQNRAHGASGWVRDSPGSGPRARRARVIAGGSRWMREPPGSCTRSSRWSNRRSCT